MSAPGSRGTADAEYDVIVVGAGPVGLTAALLLDRAGLRTALVERREGPTGHPSGHVINPRSLEIWRQIDPLLERDIRNDSAAAEDLRYIVWCTSLAGQELGRLRIVPSDPAALAALLAFSPGRHAHYPQSRLEARLWRQVLEQAPLVDFVRGAVLQDFDHDSRGVSAQLHTAQGARTLRGRYLLAADGARSSIREKLGIAMPGPMLARIASIHFRARLDRLIRGRPAVIYWIYNARLLGPLVRHQADEWILMALLHPPQRPEHFDEAHWRELIREALGTRAVDVKVNAISTWAMTAQVAERFREGRIFLVGDAAHRFPPTGGYGINTGVQDVHNLVWKLKAVIDGRAGDALLDTYQGERKAVAEKNCQRSIENQHEMDSVNEAVGLPMDNLHRVHRMMESRLFRALPERWQLRIVDFISALGLQKIKWLGEESWRGRRARGRLARAIAGQRAHFGGAHGVELGYRYAGSLSLPAPESAAETSHSDLEYRPATVPGQHLPHAWLEREGRYASTLDTLDYGALQLIVDPAWRQEWAEALEQAQPVLRYPARLLPIGAGENGDWRPADDRWPMLRGVDASGAILVRPDGHVAWRSGALPVDPAATLSSTFRQLDQAFGSNPEGAVRA